jgi:ribosomal protein S18 acetylase RimI-like enzyme
VIRPLQPADAAAFQALRLQALREAPSAFASSHDEEAGTPLATVAGRLAVAPGRCVLGAFDGPVLVGLTGLRRETMHKLAHKAEVWGVYVVPAQRRRGLGRQLLRAALAEAAAMPGVRQLNLGVNAGNVAAIALYRGLGFEPFGVERGFLQVDGVLHDEIHMACLLVKSPPPAPAAPTP